MISIIDYGPYFAGARGALEGVAVDVARACENVGFFYALNHGVSDDKIDRAFAAASVPRLAARAKARAQAGRQQYGLPGDQRLDTGRLGRAQATRLPGLRAGIMAYFDALRAMCHRMLPPFAVALGLSPITSRRISPTKPTPICVFCTIRRRIP